MPDSPFANGDAREQSWDGGSHCFAMITIIINGQTTQAQIVDRVGRRLGFVLYLHR